MKNAQIKIRPLIGTLYGPDYIELIGKDDAWLHHHTPMTGPIFHFSRVSPDPRYDGMTTGERVVIAGHPLTWRTEYVPLLREGKLWVNRHNDSGYPYAFVVEDAKL